jgi:hypothetical protein
VAARWVAFTLLLTMLAIVGIFVWAVIRPPAPPSSGTEATPVAAEKRIAAPSGSWTLAAQVIPAGERTLITILAKDAQGRPVTSSAAPTAVLRMTDMAMEPDRVALIEDGPGLWRGSTRLSMAGRWNLQVELNGETLSVLFEAGAR